MRIMFFSSIFPRPYAPNRGIFCFHLCHALESSGHQVRIMSPRSWLEKTRSNSVAPPADLAALQVEYPRFFYTPRVLRSAYGMFMQASVGKKLRRAIAAWKPDCVLSYWAHPDGAVAVRAAHDAGIPGAIIVGGSDVLILPKTDPARGRRVAAALQKADAVITVSGHLRHAAIQLDISGHHIHVVYQGVDDRLFSPGPQEVARQHLNLNPSGPMLLFVGNLVGVKGIDVLLRAGARVLQRTKFHLYLIGTGPLRAKLERLSHQLGLSELVTFVGSVAQNDLPHWYRAADLTVMASHSEGIPNVLRESMACATPFVATDVGGIHEIADPRLSRLVPPNSPTELADAISAELASPRKRVRGPISTWEHSSMLITSLLENCIANRKAATVGHAIPTHEPHLV